MTFGISDRQKTHRLEKKNVRCAGRIKQTDNTIGGDTKKKKSSYKGRWTTFARTRRPIKQPHPEERRKKGKCRE